MKIATMKQRLRSASSASGRSRESSITVTNMIGAKTSPRLSVRRHDGACGSRRGRGSSRCAATLLGLRRRSSGVELVALVVLPDVLVTLLLRPAATLLARRPCGDYAGLLQAIRPPAITVCTTGPPRWYARCRQSSARGGRRRRRSPARAVPSGRRARARAPRSRCMPASASSGASPAACRRASRRAAGSRRTRCRG